MSLSRVLRGLGRTACVAVAVLAGAGALPAQAPAGPAATVVRLSGSLSDSLPADSTEQALGFFPGVGVSDFGELVLRGGLPGGHATYLDGVPIAPGYRGAGVQSGSAGTRLGIAPNAFASATVTLGAPSASWGNGASGVLAYESPAARSTLGGSVRYGTDEVFGAAHGLGINRIEGSIGGPLGRGLSFEVAGVVSGQRSAETGAESNGVPIFVRGGADTVVGVPQSVGDPTSDTVLVEVSRFLLFRGECAAVAGSVNPGIADNYGAACQGTRDPVNAVSRADVLGTVRYRLDDRNAVWLTAAASQDQRRLFDYVQVNVPQQIPGLRNASRAVTLGFSREPGRGFLGAGVHAGLSFQLDQSERGPLTIESDVETWYPWGGFLLAPLDFEFGFERFAVNDELVDNYRFNRAGTRRSPYDLENSDQYELYSQYRTNAYAFAGFPEGGGPEGRLTMLREERTVGVGRLTWRLTDSQELTVGGELIDFEIKNYNHALTSQTFSDVYIESPTLWAGFVEDRFRLGHVSITAGLRYDRFSSGAERPYLLDLTLSSPTFDEYVPFPRPASYRQNNNTAPDGRPLTIFREDESYSAVSPRVQIGAGLSPSLDLYVSAGRLVQAPDFGPLYAGINTDASITNTGQPWGDDLGFERVNLAEVGLHKRFRGVAVHGVVFYKDWNNVPRLRLQSRQDPLTGRVQDLLIYTDDESQSVRGLELRVDATLGAWVHGFAAYSLADAEDAEGIDVPEVRPNTLVGVIQAAPPAGWGEGSTIGAIVSDLSLTTSIRFASGSAYTRCVNESANLFLISPDFCVRQFEGERNSLRLPSIKQIDLRLSKGFEVGGTTVSAFLDVRNLLGADRVRQVFLVTGTTENLTAEEILALGRLESYANESSANGALLVDGSLDLTFGTGGCGDWIDQAGSGAAPSCVYLIRAEERFGNGDGVFDLTEQRRVTDSFYQTQFGRHTFLGAPRRLRMGLSVGF